MKSGDSWGDAILHNFNEGDENSEWKENALMFDGVDDGIKVKDNSDYSKGITLEIYFTLKGKGSSEITQILMMKRTNVQDGFFIFLEGENFGDDMDNTPKYGKLVIDLGGCGNKDNRNRFYTNAIVRENEPTYITYTYDPNKENDNDILYVNGKEIETTNLGIIENMTSLPENIPIQIGADTYKTGQWDDDYNRTYAFNGEIYASRVYNRTLTEQEVLYNYNITVNNK